MWWTIEERRHSSEGNRGLWDEFQGSGGERGEQQRPGKEGEGWEAEWGGSKPGIKEEVAASTSNGSKQLAAAHSQGIMLPIRWTSSSSWISQVLASELSLIAFILLLVMAFSKKWLNLSGSRFYQRWPVNVTAMIHTKAHIMSMGLLQICKSRSCYTLEHGKVTFIFFTLMLFPINLWIFEWKRNLSIPIGWSYFIGWLVFLLYVTCAILCYFNQKNFWSLVLTHPFDTVSCRSSFGSTRGSLSENTEIIGSQMEPPNSEKKEDVPVTISEGS
ncbi:outer dense fiber protein 4 [Loxodonta africana]